MRHGIIKAVFFIFTIFLTAGLGWGQTIYSSTAPKTFAWDAPPWETNFGENCLHQPVPGRYLEYELQFVRDGTGDVYSYATRDLTMKVRPPRSGVYSVRVRTKLMNSDGTRTRLCPDEVEEIPASPWCEANSPCGQIVPGTNGPWKIRYRPSAPLGPIILK